MDGTISGAERAASSVTTTDQRALVLIDALGARLVEAIKAGVNATADGLGVLAGETERLDQRIGALAELLERSAPVEATVDLTPILETLAELRSILADRSEQADVATRDQLEAEGMALAARLDALETTVRSELAGLADHVSSIVATTEGAAPVDLSPVLAELAEHRDRAPLDELKAVVDERIAALRAALPVTPDLAPVVEAVNVRLAEVRGSLQGRIADVQASVEAGPDLSPVTNELASAVAALTERLERIEAAVTAGVDLAPVTEQVAATVAEARETLVSRVAALQETVDGRSEELRSAVESGIAAVESGIGAVTGAVAVGVEQAAVRHDAVTARLAALELDLQSRATAGDVLEAIAAIRSGVEVLSDRLDTTRGASADDARAMHEAVLHAVDALTADVAAVRERAIATADAGARSGQEVREALDAIGQQTAARIDGLHEIFSHGTDLTPFLESVAGIEAAVADVRSAVEHHAPGAGILELLRSMGDLRSTVADGHDHVAAELAEARSSVERWLAQLDSTVSHVAGTQAEDIAGLIELAEEVRALGGTAAEQTADAARRLTDIEARLATAEDRHGDDAARLAAIVDTTAVTAERAAALAEWTEAQRFQAWVADLQRSLDEKLTEVTRAVPAVRDAVEQVQDTVRRAGDATSASLEGLRSHLATAGGFTGQVERFRELRAAVDAVAAELARSRATDLAPTLVASIDEAAARAVARLEATTSSAMADLTRRDGEILHHNSEVENGLARSIERIEAEVRDVVSGLGSSERFVRNRFADVESALQDLRGEVAHVRTVRAAIDALTSSLDVLRHQAKVSGSGGPAGD